MMNKSSYTRLAMLWIVIALLILLIGSTTTKTITVHYFPVFPVEGDPLFIKVNLRNPKPYSCRFKVAVYSDGVKITDSMIVIPGNGMEELEFVTPAKDLLGTSQRIYVEAYNMDSNDKYEASIMIPPYPPEIFSSFVSFASFSSTVMSYLTTFAYYQETMISKGINVGLVISFALIGLLIFQELSDPAYGIVDRRILELRERYGKQVAILLIVFFGMVLTKIILILWGRI